jgi:hypothetical protein
MTPVEPLAAPGGYPRRGRPPLAALCADQDTITTAQVASHLGLSRRETGRWLRRHGIQALGREFGAAGQNLYPGELVRREDLASPPARRYDPWRDAKDTHIPVGARVEQVAVAKEHGALASRVHQRAQVTRWGHGTRLLVRFEGETEPVSIRPHLLRVLDSMSPR